MISKKYLRDFEFISIENYFDYIIICQARGNYFRVKSLFKKLSGDQKRLFMAYIQPFNANLKGNFDLRRLY